MLQDSRDQSEFLYELPVFTFLNLCLYKTQTFQCTHFIYTITVAFAFIKEEK